MDVLEEVPLSTFTVGMWATRSRSDELWLLVQPHKRKLVLLCDRSSQSRAFSALQQLGARSPFSSKHYGTQGCVFAFEIDLDDIIGMDYHNPLCDEGRVAFECMNLTKREFKHLYEARAYYGSANPQLSPDKIKGEVSPLRHGNSVPCPKGNLMLRLDTLATRPGPSLPPDEGTPSTGTIPPAISWTSTAGGYHYRTLIVRFNDHRVSDALRLLISGDERLLKLYESGLPAWAMFLPQFGIWYRPWLRYLTWFLFYLFSVVSLLAGFYDLYKSLPGLQTFLQSIASSFWLPPSSIFEWLEGHTQIRMSLLLTYLFGKSDLFVALMRRLAPALHVLRPAVKPLWNAMMPLSEIVKCTGSQLMSIIQVGLAPLTAFFSEIWMLLSGIAMPFLGVVRELYFWCSRLAQQVTAIGIIGYTGLLEAGRGVAAGASTVAQTTRTAGATDLQTWTYFWDAWAMVRVSSLRMTRALQAVIKFFVQMGSNAWRHRLTLSIKCRRFCRKMKSLVYAWATIPVELMVHLINWLTVAVKVFINEDVDEGGDKYTVESDKKTD